MSSPDFSATCPDCGAVIEPLSAGHEESQGGDERLPMPEPQDERAVCPQCGLELARVDEGWVPDVSTGTA